MFHFQEGVRDPNWWPPCWVPAEEGQERLGAPESAGGGEAGGLLPTTVLKQWFSKVGLTGIGSLHFPQAHGLGVQPRGPVSLIPPSGADLCPPLVSVPSREE